jgi:hypothetical protein
VKWRASEVSQKVLVGALSQLRERMRINAQTKLAKSIHETFWIFAKVEHGLALKRRA